jgi:hypothetical protein
VALFGSPDNLIGQLEYNMGWLASATVFRSNLAYDMILAT